MCDRPLLVRLPSIPGGWKWGTRPSANTPWVLVTLVLTGLQDPSPHGLSPSHFRFFSSFLNRLGHFHPSRRNTYTGTLSPAPSQRSQEPISSGFGRSIIEVTNSFQGAKSSRAGQKPSCVTSTSASTPTRFRKVNPARPEHHTLLFSRPLLRLPCGSSRNWREAAVFALEVPPSLLALDPIHAIPATYLRPRPLPEIPGSCALAEATAHSGVCRHLTLAESSHSPGRAPLTVFPAQQVTNPPKSSSSPPSHSGHPGPLTLVANDWISSGVPAGSAFNVSLEWGHISPRHSEICPHLPPCVWPHLPTPPSIWLASTTVPLVTELQPL